MYIRGNLGTDRGHFGKVARGIAAGLGKQFLNLSLSACVLTLAELLVADTSLSIEKVKRRPIDVVECIPDRVLIVDGDGVVDMDLAHPGPDILQATRGRSAAFCANLRRYKSKIEQSPPYPANPRQFAVAR